MLLPERQVFIVSVFTVPSATAVHCTVFMSTFSFCTCLIKDRPIFKDGQSENIHTEYKTVEASSTPPRSHRVEVVEVRHLALLQDGAQTPHRVQAWSLSRPLSKQSPHAGLF